MAHLTPFKRSAITTGVLTALGLASGTALAQQAEGAAGLEEIVITGSRIVSPNATSSSPILAVSAENLAFQGINDTGDLIDTLPQQITTGADLSNTNNPLTGPGGVTTVNLRGLGPQRTLVLVDGRRLGVGDPNSGNPNPAPDINQIPAGLIERVDVVTGGASAVYGSDAIAGVVNFILRRDFEGVEINAQYGFNQHNQNNDYMEGLVEAGGLPLPKNDVTDGDSKSVNVLVGGNFADGRGNAVAYLSYLKVDPVRLEARDFGACQLAGTDAAGTPNGTICQGSSNSNRFRPLSGPNTATRLAVVGDQLLPWGGNSNPPAIFNSNPYMNLLHGTERYQAGILAKYDFSERAQVYADFMFTDDRHDTAVAPSGLFTTSTYNVNCNNPLMSDQQRTAIGCSAQMIADGTAIPMEIGRRNVEGGPRMFGYEHENYRGVLGVKGDINDAWSYDAYGSYYYTTLFNSNENYISISRAQSAMNGCLDGAPGCVPWDIWTDGGVTPEAAEWVSTYGISNGTSSQEILAASVTGDLGEYGLKLPSAQEGVGIAMGVEYRKDGFSFLPDQALGSGDLSGGGGASPTIDESADVKEGFIELRVPLVQDRPGAQDLTFEAGYRYSDYELSGGVDTYKAGLQWAPIPDLRLRASYNHAIRAPSLIELFVAQTVTTTSQVAVDPCSPNNGAPATASLADCQRTGVTAAQYGDGLATNTIPQCVSNQCSTLIGGNPELKPEEADTVSLGLTITPQALPGLAISIDWYRIELTDLVGAIPLDVSLQGCLDGSNLGYCANVVRNPTSGAISSSNITDGGGYIIGTGANIAEGTFTGIDVQTSFTKSLGKYGNLVTTANAVKVLETTTIPLAGEHEYDCAGLYGSVCGPAIPDWRNTLRLTWQTPKDVDVSLQWRHIGSVGHEQNTSDETLSGDAVDFGGTLSSRDYFDLAANWHINDNYIVRMGVNNIADQDPPLVDTGWSGPGTPNTWGPYDTLGRQIFMAMSAKF